MIFFSRNLNSAAMKYQVGFSAMEETYRRRDGLLAFFEGEGKTLLKI